MKNKNLTTGEILEIKRKLIIKFETCIVATFGGIYEWKHVT